MMSLHGPAAVRHTRCRHNASSSKYSGLGPHPWVALGASFWDVSEGFAERYVVMKQSRVGIFRLLPVIGDSIHFPC